MICVQRYDACLETRHHQEREIVRNGPGLPSMHITAWLVRVSLIERSHDKEARSTRRKRHDAAVWTRPASRRPTDRQDIR